MRAKRKARVPYRVLFAASALTAAFWGCGDSEGERELAREIAEDCSHDSDCRGLLVCLYERCHQPCKEDEDCSEVGGLCVQVPDDLQDDPKTVGVCQLPEHASCASRGCKGDQVCAEDKRCRDTCADDDDCYPGLTCASSDVCAQEGEVGPDGDLLGAGGSPTGAGGEPGLGEAGRGGSGGSVESGGAGETSGSAGEGGASGLATGGAFGLGTGGAGGNAGMSGGTGGTASGASGAGGDGAGGTDALGDFDYVEGDDGHEPIPNGDRDNTIPLPSAASIYLPANDQDWFSVETPDDGRAHVIELMLEQSASLQTRVYAYAAADDSLVRATPVQLSTGVSQPVFISVAPNAVTHVVFVPFRGTGRLNFTYALTAENDEYEPNNDKASAAPIELDTPISAQQLRPVLDEATYAESIADWYAVSLEEGTVTIDVESVPENVGLDFWIYRPNNSSASILRLARGVFGASSPFAVTEAGVHHLLVTEHRNSALSSMEGTVKPAHMSEQYRFRVTQP